MKRTRSLGIVTDGIGKKLRGSVRKIEAKGNFIVFSCMLLDGKQITTGP